MFQMEKEVSVCQRLGTRISEDLMGGHQGTVLTSKFMEVNMRRVQCRGQGSCKGEQADS